MPYRSTTQGDVNVLTPGVYANLPPASMFPGATAYITDGSTSAIGATVTGGGANKVVVRSDGSNWLVMGGDGGGGGLLQALVTTQFDVTNSTTLADVPGLSIQFQAGRKYRGRATLYTNIGNPGSGGMKVGLGFTGTTNVFRAHGLPIIGSTTPANGTTITAPGQIASGFSSFTEVEISFYVDVATAGALAVTFSQGGIAGTSSVQVGSNMMTTVIG